MISKVIAYTPRITASFKGLEKTGTDPVIEYEEKSDKVVNLPDHRFFYPNLHYETAQKMHNCRVLPIQITNKDALIENKIQRLIQKRPILTQGRENDIYDWVEQFDNYNDKKIALKMLKNITYIDIENARKAYKKLYNDLQEKEGVDINKTNFATLGNAKSASMMGYLFRQANKLRFKGPVKHEYKDENGTDKSDKFISYKDLQSPDFNLLNKSKDTENLVLIDDILGDGDSLIEFLTPQVIESLSQYQNIYYLTLVKDPDGEKRLSEKFKDLNIKFIAAQDIHKYDSPLNTNFTEEEKLQIKKLIDKYDSKISPENKEKYSRSKLLVSFDWNSPGNLPMMFNFTNDNWQGLFQRYNGLEKTDVSEDFDFNG